MGWARKGLQQRRVDFILGLAEYWPKHERIEDALLRDPKFLGIGGAHGLEALGRRPYWKRVWIIQELMNGHAETPVICGSKVIDWTTMCKGVEVFISMDLPAAVVIADRQNLGYPKSDLAFGTLYNITQLSNLMDLRYQIKDPKIIPVLMNCSRRASSTDDRDNMYGMLDLMEHKLSSLIVPDYTKTASQAYASLASAYIAAYDHIDIIRHGGLSTSAIHPSWAPD